MTNFYVVMEESLFHYKNSFKRDFFLFHSFIWHENLVARKLSKSKQNAGQEINFCFKSPSDILFQFFFLND